MLMQTLTYLDEFVHMHELVICFARIIKNQLGEKWFSPHFLTLSATNSFTSSAQQHQSTFPTFILFASSYFSQVYNAEKTEITEMHTQ